MLYRSLGTQLTMSNASITIFSQLSRHLALEEHQQAFQTNPFICWLSIVSMEHLGSSKIDMTKYIILRKLNLIRKEVLIGKLTGKTNKSKVKCCSCGNCRHFAHECSEPNKVHIYPKSLLNCFLKSHV